MALNQDSRSVLHGSASAPLALVRVQFDFDSSYPTGGEPLSALAGLSGYTPVAVFQHAALASGRRLILSADGTKVLVLDNAGAEVANTTDLSGMTNTVVTFLCY